MNTTETLTINGHTFEIQSWETADGRTLGNGHCVTCSTTDRHERLVHVSANISTVKRNARKHATGTR